MTRDPGRSPPQSCPRRRPGRARCAAAVGRVIADFDVTERMLRYFIQQVHRRRRLARPRLVVAVPSGITGVEQSAVQEAGRQAGARRAYIIEEPMAAAIGAGLPVYEPAGNMVVDVGGGTPEVAVISLGAVVTPPAVPGGGCAMYDAVR